MPVSVENLLKSFEEQQRDAGANYSSIIGTAACDMLTQFEQAREQQEITSERRHAKEITSLQISVEEQRNAIERLSSAQLEAETTLARAVNLIAARSLWNRRSSTGLRFTVRRLFESWRLSFRGLTREQGSRVERAVERMRCRSLRRYKRSVLHALRQNASESKLCRRDQNTELLSLQIEASKSRADAAESRATRLADEARHLRRRLEEALQEGVSLLGESVLRAVSGIADSQGDIQHRAAPMHPDHHDSTQDTLVADIDGIPASSSTATGRFKSKHDSLVVPSGSNSSYDRTQDTYAGSAVPQSSNINPEPSMIILNSRAEGRLSHRHSHSHGHGHEEQPAIDPSHARVQEKNHSAGEGHIEVVKAIEADGDANSDVGRGETIDDMDQGDSAPWLAGLRKLRPDTSISLRSMAPSNPSSTSMSLPMPVDVYAQGMGEVSDTPRISAPALRQSMSPLRVEPAPRMARVPLPQPHPSLPSFIDTTRRMHVGYIASTGPGPDALDADHSTSLVHRMPAAADRFPKRLAMASTGSVTLIDEDQGNPGDVKDLEGQRTQSRGITGSVTAHGMARKRIGATDRQPTHPKESGPGSGSGPVSASRALDGRVSVQTRRGLQTDQAMRRQVRRGNPAQFGSSQTGPVDSVPRHSVPSQQHGLSERLAIVTGRDRQGSESVLESRRNGGLGSKGVGGGSEVGGERNRSRGGHRGEVRRVDHVGQEGMGMGVDVAGEGPSMLGQARRAMSSVNSLVVGGGGGGSSSRVRNHTDGNSLKIKGGTRDGLYGSDGTDVTDGTSLSMGTLRSAIVASHLGLHKASTFGGQRQRQKQGQKQRHGQTEREREADSGHRSQGGEEGGLIDASDDDGVLGDVYGLNTSAVSSQREREREREGQRESSLVTDPVALAQRLDVSIGGVAVEGMSHSRSTGLRSDGTRGNGPSQTVADGFGRWTSPDLLETPVYRSLLRVNRGGVRRRD